MPSRKRVKTKYTGVYYVKNKDPITGKMENTFYIRYRRQGKQIDEKAGHQFRDDMTAAKASRIRVERALGKKPSNREKREREKRKWTFDRLWDEYKEVNSHLRGLVKEENRYSKHIKNKIGKKEPKDLIPIEIDRIRINSLKKLKPATVQNILALIKILINFGVKRGLCKGVDFRIKMPRVDNKITEDLTKEQLKKLQKVLSRDKNRQVANMMKLALFTGMRRGELFRLKWKDIDLERGFIRIRNPKGGKEQVVPMNDVSRTVLLDHPRVKGSLFVFPGRNGGMRVEAKSALNRIKKEAGLPVGFRPMHGLRHVYASALASSGKVDMYTLQKLLTHKSSNMTQRYAHLRDEALKEACEIAGSIILNKSS